MSNAVKFTGFNIEIKASKTSKKYDSIIYIQFQNQIDSLFEKKK